MFDSTSHKHIPLTNNTVTQCILYLPESSGTRVQLYVKTLGLGISSAFKKQVGQMVATAKSCWERMDLKERQSSPNR